MSKPIDERTLPTNPAAELGRRGGAARGGAKAEAARDNGAKGGRPRQARYRIATPDGRLRASAGAATLKTYATREEAVDAVRRAYGWDEAHVSPDFATSERDEEGAAREVSAVCVYETAEERDADEEGAHAPRVVETYER